ncbi:MAG TPA: dTDP-4-dehydrorhamnose reductase [Candidatus Cybelea sp.]|nr:dTDP-4-dehydrorhamnose reductase [Candidatus Cybelea sp.]
MTLRILLTGKNGQVGSELAKLLPSVGELTAVGRSELDLRKPHDIRRLISESRPNLVINAAAYTAVDLAEREESLAHVINTDAPALIAEEAKRIGATVIHYSTDYVFDGWKRTPYVEGDLPHPLSAYGRSKLGGEEAIRACGIPHLILRTAWVYATSGRNFLLTVLRLASTREELRIVNDQFGAPTWARAIAEATARLLLGFDPSAGVLARLGSVAGTYHLTAAGETTWYEFAVAILDEVRKSADMGSGRSLAELAWFRSATEARPIVAKRVVPIPTRDYPTPARRPAYSVLSNARFASTFGFSLPDWRSQLADAMAIG